MPRSAIREVMALAATRPDVIHLEVGEPDLPTPVSVVEGAFRAAREGHTKYTSNAGIPELRSLIARRVSARYGRSITAERVVVTTGAVGALFGAIMAVVDTGDEILLPDPGWPNYVSIAHLAGAVPVRFAARAERAFIPDPAEIAAKITPRTKAILINTPGNPTGAVYPKDCMTRIADIARHYGIYVISDEIYEDIVFEGVHASIATEDIDDRAFLVSGFSKTYAMTGWRLGYVICPERLSGVISGLQEPTTSCASSISQWAGIAALTGSQAVIAESCATYRRRRDMVVEMLGKHGLLPVTPAGSFYALVDISRTRQESLSFSRDLLLSVDVAVVPGITFGPGCDSYVRIAFTIDDDKLRSGLERLTQYILAHSQARLLTPVADPASASAQSR